MKKFRPVLVLICLIICIASLTACSRAEQFFVYGTNLEIQSKGIKSSQTISAIHSYIASLEDVLSATQEGSDIYNVNHSKAGVAIECSDVTMQIMRVAYYVFEESDGA